MIIKTQKEWDALPASFEIFTVIEIRSPENIWLSISKNPTNAHVEARESSHVEARESSHVEARGSSHVEAWGSSHVEARESSHVVARGSSHVEAWGSSHVVARESSHVEAWGAVSVHVQSEFSLVDLFGYAVCILMVKCKATLKSRTAKIVRPILQKGVVGWLDREGIELEKGHVIIFKRVSKDFKTQEKTANETLWAIGSTVTCAKYNPKESECGEGKFHACSRPYFCDEFREAKDDRYIAIKVLVKDMHAWEGASYPHKIGFKGGTILFECDKFGKKIA